MALVFVICYMFVCVVPSSHARARRKSASDFSFIHFFSNASDSLKGKIHLLNISQAALAQWTLSLNFGHGS